jgi:hypothetical protein
MTMDSKKAIFGAEKSWQDFLDTSSNNERIESERKK